MGRKSWTLLGCAGMLGLAVAVACSSDDGSKGDPVDTGGQGGDASTGGSAGNDGLAGSGAVGGAGGAKEDPGPVIVNGSFETGDYTGWTIIEDGAPQAYLVEADGTEIEEGVTVYDHYTGEMVAADMCPIPEGFIEASDGTRSAVWTQFDEGTHAIEQKLTIPGSRPIFAWDMKYLSEVPISANQNLVVAVLSPDEELLEEFMITEIGDPEGVLEMTPYWVDLSEYADQEVRVRVVANVRADCLVFNFDNFRFLAAAPEAGD